MVVVTGTRSIRDCRSAQPVWAITNLTEDFAIDCNNTSDGELADVLGTLIRTLIEQGILVGSTNTGA